MTEDQNTHGLDFRPPRERSPEDEARDLLLASGPFLEKLGRRMGDAGYRLDSETCLRPPSTAGREPRTNRAACLRRTKRRRAALYTRSRRAYKPRRALIFDTETTIDATQALLFGSYRYVRISWQDNTPTLSTVEEGLIYADELPAENAERFAVLRDYQASHPAALDPAYSHGLQVALKFYSRREFLREMFYPAVYESRALVAGFNLPFDLSRLAVDWSPARKTFAGGFSLAVFEYEKDGVWRENRFKPRIVVKSIDSKRALKGFAGTFSPDEIDTIPEGETEPEEGYIFRGNFLDLRTLGFVLTDKGHTLESACEAFGVEHGKTKANKHGEITPEYIDYNRRDVLATTELLREDTC